LSGRSLVRHQNQGRDPPRGSPSSPASTPPGLFAGCAAAHHNSGIGDVKCTLWCRMSRQTPSPLGLGPLASDRKGDDQLWVVCLIDIAEKTPQIRSAPNSRELWDARTALPQVCSRRTIRSASETVHSTFVLSAGTKRPCGWLCLITHENSGFIGPRAEILGSSKRAGGEAI
jgi:hypothetical protein